MDVTRGEHPAVAVVDSVPTYRLGLKTALAAAEFKVVEPEDVRSWFRMVGHAVVSITLRSNPDKVLLRELHEDRPSVPLIAILPMCDHAAFRDALLIGALAAVAWDVETEGIVDVVRAATRGRSLLPAEIVRSLVLGAESEAHISDLERNWLDRLARGARVTELAQQAGYSEREMHRLLRRLYRRLGADSRSAALVKAARLGLLQ